MLLDVMKLDYNDEERKRNSCSYWYGGEYYLFLLVTIVRC